MSIHTAKSKKSSKLYIVAAILMFIQTGVIAVVLPILPGLDWNLLSTMRMYLWLLPLIGVLFLVGSFFARTGIGVTAVVERDSGRGYATRTVETANGITCGCMTGIAVLGIAITFAIQYASETYGLVFVGIIPGIIAGFTAIYAGIVSLRATMAQGTQPSYSTPQVPPDSRTCSYCGKVGISPMAESCPNCGEPF